MTIKGLVRVINPEKPNYGIIGRVTIPVGLMRPLAKNEVLVVFGSYGHEWFCRYHPDDIEEVNDGHKH